MGSVWGAGSLDEGRGEPSKLAEFELLEAGEGWLGVLGTLAGVHLDSGDSLSVACGSFPSSHHNSVLKFNSTRMAENEG